MLMASPAGAAGPGRPPGRSTEEHTQPTDSTQQHLFYEAVLTLTHMDSDDDGLTIRQDI